jgi:hypothetical protein
MARRYRRRKSPASGIIRDVTHIASRLSWKACVAFGSASFVMLFWLIPGWFESYIASRPQSTFSSALEPLFNRRLHFFKLLGITSALICAFFAIRNYHTSERMNSNGKSAVGFFARFLARFLD